MSFHKCPGHLLRAKPKVFFLAFVLSWHLSSRYQDISPFWNCVNLLWVTLWKTASTVVEPESPGAMAALILSIIGDTKLYQQVKPFLDWTNVFLLPRALQCHFPEVNIEEIDHIHYYHCNDSSEYDLSLQYLPLGNDTEEPVVEGKHLFNPKKVSPAGTASCLRWCSGSKQPSLQDSLVRQL